MPAARKCRLSVAPALMLGTMGSPGARAWTALVTAATISARSGIVGHRDPGLRIGDDLHKPVTHALGADTGEDPAVHRHGR